MCLSIYSASELSQGGYRYDWVETPPSEYVCGHCLHVAKDPQQLRCCGLIYCKNCLVHNDIKCSGCDTTVRTNYLPDKRINLAIAKLRAYCTNRCLCCDWIGAVGDMKAHRNSCPFSQALCDNGCGQMIARKDAEAHAQKFCPKRQVTCQYCKAIVRHDSMESGSHFLHCQAYPTPCPHEGCSDVIPKCILQQHKDICPHGPAPCIYRDIGCFATLLPSDRETHNRHCVQEHLMMAVKRLHELEAASVCGKSIVLKVTNFQKLKEEDDHWRSPQFYSSAGGYRAFVNVYPNGTGEGRTTHISCSVNLATGDYDRMLKWPLEAEVSLEILNQLEDKNHITCVVVFNEETPNGNGGWIEKFVQHSELTSLPSCQYVRNDALYIRVTHKIHSKPLKPWLTADHHSRHHRSSQSDDHSSHCGTDNSTLYVVD